MNLIVGLGNPGPEYSQTRHNLGFAVIDALVQSWGVSMTSNSKLHGFVGKDIPHDAILLMPTTYMNNSGQAVKATMEYYKIETSKMTQPNLPLAGEGPGIHHPDEASTSEGSSGNSAGILRPAQNDGKPGAPNTKYKTSPALRAPSSPIKLRTGSNRRGELATSTSSTSKLRNFETSKLVIIHDDLDIPLGTLKIQPGGGGHGGHNGVRSVIQHSNSPDFIRFRLGIGRPPHPQIAPADWVLQKPSGQEVETLASLVNTTAHAIESLLKNGIDPTMNQYNSKAE